MAAYTRFAVVDTEDNPVPPEHSLLHMRDELVKSQK